MVAADAVVVFTPIAAALAAVSIGALIKIVRVFLQHIEDKDQQFTTFLGNHMSGNTKALENLTSATTKLTDRFEYHAEAVEDLLKPEPVAEPRPRSRKAGSTEPRKPSRS